jgi:hypothetical protein
MLGNGMLRRILRVKKVAVTGEWRKFHSEELHNFCSSPSIIRVNKSVRRFTAYVWGRREII